MFVKHDKSKNRLDLVDPEFYKQLGEVLTHGANKYEAFNWVKCEDPSRYIAAVERHWNAWRLGEEKDQETGLSHLAHAAVNLMFIHYFARKRLISYNATHFTWNLGDVGNKP